MSRWANVRGAVAASAWNPSLLPHQLGFIQVPLVGDTTGIVFGTGTQVASIKGAAGTPILLAQGTPALRPLYDAASPLDGHAALQLVNALGTQITQAAGGPTGVQVPHWMWALVKRDSGANSYCGYARFGASGAAAINSFLGDNGPSTWYGRGGNGAPAYGSDTNVHLLEKYYDGANVWICFDGMIVRDGATVGTPVPTPDAGYNIVSAEFGLGGGFTGTADAHVYTAGWGTGAIVPVGYAPRFKLAQWVRAQYPSLAMERKLWCYGDSQTAGNGPTTPWPAQLINLSLLTHPYLEDTSGAVAGYTTTNILASTPYNTTGQWDPSGLRTTNVAVVWAGTNDLYAGGTGAAAWANLQTICATLRATGATIIIVTCLPRQEVGTPGTYEPERLILNADIRNGYTNVADLLFDVAAVPQFQDPSNLTYYQADKVHLSQTGQNLFATLISAYINALG